MAGLLKGGLAPLMHTIEEWMCAKDSFRTYIRSGQIGFCTLWKYKLAIQHIRKYASWTANSVAHTHTHTYVLAWEVPVAEIMLECSATCTVCVPDQLGTCAKVCTVNVLVVTVHAKHHQCVTYTVSWMSCKSVIGRLRVGGCGMERECAAEMGYSGQILLACGLSCTHD